MADFNPACAQWVYDTISKMDDAEAEAFSLVFVHDLWTNDMLANERYVRGINAKQDAALTEEVAKSLVEHLDAGGDPEEAVAIAAAVAIAKADHDAWKFQERDRGGRFGRMTGAQYRARAKEAKAQSKVNLADLRAQRRGQVNRIGSGAVGAAREFEQGWNRPPTESGATDTFNRLAAGGKLVQQVGNASGSQKAAIAGAVANYAGQFGPEAEKVVGPSMRRAAYRYRGTERTPDKMLTNLSEIEARSLLRNEAREAGTTKQVVTTADGKRKTVNVPNRTAMAGLSPEEKVFSTENAAIKYFTGAYATQNGRGPSRVPSARLSELQRHSGKITPSEGVIIDAKGNVAHQAVGYGEDHYLPFNLKNLGALKGGSYVRTRESGGLTTEDVYTGLVSGARSMTVVSNSGVFTVDFADDLRGGRRYNDKARQMVSRYGKTLDAVKSQQVKNPDRQLPANERARIRIDAEDRVNSDPLLAGFSEEERETWIKAAVNEELSKPRLSKDELDAIERKARSGTDDPREQRVILRELTDEAMDKLNTRSYQLDGEGYAVALDAMREQFPYFIADVRYQTKAKTRGNDRSDMSRFFNTGTDEGYVKPRHNRPAGAKEGYYDESITGHGKIGADRTGYQNYAVRTKREAKAAEAEQTAEAPKTAETPDAARDRLSAENKGKADQVVYASKVGQDAELWLGIDKDLKGALSIDPEVQPHLDEFRDLDEAGRKQFLASPRKVAGLEADLDAFEKRGPSGESIVERLSDVIIPGNRKAHKKKMARANVASVIDADFSPSAPPAIEAKDLQAYLGNTQFMSYLQREDSELQTVSNKLRDQREKGGNREQLNRQIHFVESARAHKATKPPEMDSEDFKNEMAAQGVGKFKALPKVNGEKTRSAAEGHIQRLIRDKDDMHPSDFESELRDILGSPDADDMSDEYKATVYRQLTGNILR